MAASSPIWNQVPAHGSPMANPRAMASTSGTGTSSGATDASSTISSNDFLTLLVTEMKNQDPTSATDPNEYINQLVSVNSLEQLIQINQTLASAANPPSASSSSVSASGQIGPAAPSPAQPGLSPHAPGSAAGAHPPDSRVTSGNLDIPAASPAARRIAQALAGGSLR